MAEEEIVSQTPETPAGEPSSPDNSKVIENYESLLKQQQTQLEQLMKQQELTNKVNQQLMSQMSNMTKGQVASAPVENEHWVDKLLKEGFDPDSKVDVRNSLDLQKNTNQIALWWLQYQKEKGLSNEEIASRYYRMVSGIESELANE